MRLLDKEGFERYWETVGDGEERTFTIEDEGRRRTRAQEKFFHGPVLKPFIEAGYRKQEAKDMLCLMFIPEDVHQLDGSIVQVPGRTSRLNVSEYNALIDSCIQLAAEQGWVIEDSDEWKAKQQQKEPRGSYKLTLAEQDAIRQQVAAGESQRSVAESFGLSHSTVKRVVRGDQGSVSA
jgi:hypothetical protein